MSLEICEGCGNEVDRSFCQCGDEISAHGYWQGHMPYPAGCDCARDFRDDDEVEAGEETGEYVAQPSPLTVAELRDHYPDDESFNDD